MRDKDSASVQQVTQRYKQLCEGLRPEKNPLQLIPLAKAAFDDPYFMAAFILWMLDYPVSPQIFYRTGLLHHFFLHHFGNLTIDDPNEAFLQTVNLLQKISVNHVGLKELLTLAHGTFCGVRGTKFNQPSGENFLFLNLLNQEGSSCRLLPETRYDHTVDHYVSMYDLPDLPDFAYSLENAEALYAFFGFHFLSLLDLENSLDLTVFLQLKAKHGLDIVEAVCDLLISNALSVHQLEPMVSHLGDVLKALPVDIFEEKLLPKNPCFLLFMPECLGLFEKLSPERVKQSMLALVALPSLYECPLILVRVILTLAAFSDHYHSFYLEKVKKTFVEKVFSADNVDLVDAVSAFQLMNAEACCQAWLASQRDNLVFQVKQGCSLEHLVMWRNGIIALDLIRMVYPNLLNTFSYLDEEKPYDILAFYIDTRWQYQSLLLPFSLDDLLMECDLLVKKSDFYFDFHAAMSMGLHALHFTSESNLIHFILQHILQNEKVSLARAVEIICLKQTVTQDVIKTVFKSLPTTRFLLSDCQPGKGIMRRPHLYSASHILLCFRWVTLCLNMPYKFVMELVNNLGLLHCRDRDVMLQRLTYLQGNFQHHALYPDFKETLKTLIAHIERGYIEFYDLLVERMTEKRLRQASMLDEMSFATRYAS